MKKVFLTIFLTMVCLCPAIIDVDRINRYADKNASGLIELLEYAHPDTLPYYEFLLGNCSSSDLAILDAEYIEENVHLALKSRQLNYAKAYNDTIFMHFVLPYRMSQEPLEDWRERFYNELKPLVENIETIPEAAILVNLWCLEQMTYKPTHGRDQSAFTSIKRGYGRCEEMMIIYMAAARSVGIPVRSCSAPYWNFTDSNHAWIEVWTNDGWKYLGEPANSLNKTWFTKTAERATLITAKAFGNYQHPNVIKQENNVTTLSSIEHYTSSFMCNICVYDEFNEPIDGAVVYPMAVSFGGIFPMIELTTDSSGCCRIPLGKGSVLMIAGKDSLYAWQQLNNLSGVDTLITLKLSKENKIDADFRFLFPLPGSNPMGKEEPVFWEDKFDLMRENADLKRKNRLLNKKKTAEFARYYDIISNSTLQDSEYFDQREKFLSKADELADNTEAFLQVLSDADNNEKWVIKEMIKTWDIKDLCEIPDSLALRNIAIIYGENRSRFGLSDSLISEGCIARTWRSASPVQNGWQEEFYEIIRHLIDVEIELTVQNMINWIKENTEIDDDFVYTYYSVPLTPLEIIKMYYIPDFYQIKLLNAGLKLSGIPVRWQGQLEYYNEGSWMPALFEEKEEENNELVNFKINIFVDGKQVKAEPWDNFLVAALNPGGDLYPIWFDGENDSLAFSGKYLKEENESIHIEAAVRNGNGDAHVAIRPLLKDGQMVEINLISPREYLDITTKWERWTKENVKNIARENGSEKNKTIIIVMAKESSEPQIHTQRLILEKLDKIIEKKVDLIFYSEGRAITDIVPESIIQIGGENILEGELQLEDYPAVFLLNEENNIVFSSTGYNMGIADLLIRKLK